ETTRAGDLASRFGGDEFTLLLPRTAGEGAVALSNRLRERLDLIAKQEELPPISVSIRVATWHGPAAPLPHDLFRPPARALYQAKAAGGNRAERTSLAEDLW